MNTISPLKCRSWEMLKELSRAPFRKNKDRFVVDAGGVHFDFSRQKVTKEILAALAQLATERGFADWRKALFAGEKINTSEKRAALHTALRAGASAPAEVKEVL